MDAKQGVSWVYSFKKDALLEALEERGLSMEGSYAVLRERLLKYERMQSEELTSETVGGELDSGLGPSAVGSVADPTGAAHTGNADRTEDTGLEGTMSRVSIACQTEDEANIESTPAVKSTPKQRRLVTFAQSADAVNTGRESQKDTRGETEYAHLTEPIRPSIYPRDRVIDPSLYTGGREPPPREDLYRYDRPWEYRPSSSAMDAREFASREYRTASSTPRGVDPEDVAYFDPYLESRVMDAPMGTRRNPDYTRGPFQSSVSRFEENARP